MDQHYYDLNEAAAELQLDLADVTKLARSGELPATWVPSQQAFFFLPADVAAYRQAHQ